MAKPENGTFRSELLSLGLYKRNQGRLARQLTFAGLALMVAAGAYVLSQGPLQGLANQYYRVVVSVPKGTEEKEKDLKELADKHSLVYVDSVVRGGNQEIQFRAPSSRLWMTSEERSADARQNADDFVAAVQQKVGLKPRAPDLRNDKPVGIIYGVPLVVCGLCLWVIFRLVNYPRFAEFLISVEAEMNKVSWASKQELYRATVVVLSTMVLLGAVLMVYDTIWYRVLQWAGVLRFTE